MIGATLNRYFAGRFAWAILMLFGVGFSIIFLFDFLEMLRGSADRPTFTWSAVFLGSLLRIPTFAEQLLPFATLFGAMTAFLGLTRRLELVVVRSAGVSVWQFMLPGLAVALSIGVLSTAVYNPLASRLKEMSDEISLSLYGASQHMLSQSSADAWLRQDGADGESIMHAEKSLEQGMHLVNVTVVTFDRRGRFHERIMAAEARFNDQRWILSNATVRAAEQAPQTFQSYAIATNLSAEQIRESLAEPDSVSFWALPRYVEIARNAGLPAYRYQLQYQMLLARPLLLMAMVLIAATVSLRVFRFGSVGRMILSGVVAGFVLYVVGEIARELGGAGLVSPVLAAWTPAVVAALLGFTILLHQEDG